MLKLASRMSVIKPSPTLEVTAKASKLKSEGYKVFELGAGEPDFDTPEHIKQAAINAMEEGKTKYTPVGGTVELKNAIIEKFSRENEIKYQRDEVIVSTGAKQVLYNAFMASLSKGDEVIIPAPYWVSYIDMAAMAEGVPVIVNCKEENNFLLQPEQLEAAITSKTKWVILGSPSNPTGSTYSYGQLNSIANVLLKHPHVNIMSDDIYEHLVYDDLGFSTIAQVQPLLKDRVLTVNGVSKAYSMTGWRIGYGAGPAHLIKAMETIQSQSTSNPCSISQAAAVAALNGPQDFLITNQEIYTRRRNLIVDMLNDVDGLSCKVPSGAFYAFANCSKLIGRTTPKGKALNNSNDVASYFLEDGFVAVVAGSAFGAEGYFRASYATSESVIEQACKKIKLLVQQLI
jgi:aspartate aminotransferase